MSDDAKGSVFLRKGQACASNLVLDRMRLGELEGTREGDETSAHLQTCGRCRERLAELAAVAAPPLDFQALAAPPSISPQARTPPRRRVWRQVLLLGSTCAAATALFLFAPWRPSTERSKGGGWQLGLVVQHASGRVERVSQGAALVPGDRVRFEVAVAQDAFVSVVSLDSRGAVTAFVPSQGGSLPVKAGRRQLLDGAVVLDDTLGPERLLLSACPRAILVDEVVTAAQAELDKVRGRIADVATLPLPCKQISLWIRKEARP